MLIKSSFKKKKQLFGDFKICNSENRVNFYVCIYFNERLFSLSPKSITFLAHLFMPYSLFSVFSHILCESGILSELFPIKISSAIKITPHAGRPKH